MFWYSEVKSAEGWHMTKKPDIVKHAEGWPLI